jgi:uncharacterized membrane protein
VLADIVLNTQLNRTNSYSFDAESVSSDTATVAPGDSASFTIRITNTGNIRDTYSLSGYGSDFTFKFQEVPVRADFGQTNNSVDTVVIVTANGEAPVDHGDVYINVESAGNPSSKKSVQIFLDIAPVYSVSGLQSGAGSIGGKLFYGTLEVTNTGNIKDNYTLTITNYQELWQNGWRATIGVNSSLSTKITDVAPGDAPLANITLVPTRSIPNNNVTIAVEIRSDSSSEATIVTLSPALPDLFFWLGMTEVQGDNFFNYDIFQQRDSENLILMAVMLSMLAAIFIIRKVKFGRFLR